MYKKNLDQPISKVFEGASNFQTLREYIRESEETFDLPKKRVNQMSEEKLKKYIEFLDDLWLK